jgi:hypothetical protein
MASAREAWVSFSERSVVTIDEVKELLRELGFPEGYGSDQTALTLMALADRQLGRKLLPGHSRLADGARIHDILNFVRADMGRRVAENTRESYRKTSLRPLVEAGWVVRHQLSTNDPNTYYTLNSEFARLLATQPGPDRDGLIEKLRLRSSRSSRPKAARPGEVTVQLSPELTFSLSPGLHNELEKAVVEVLAPALLIRPAVVYLGDTAPRSGFQDRTWMRRLNLPIDVKAPLPDVVLFDGEDPRLLIVEVVTSAGPITTNRLGQLRDFAQGPIRLGIRVEYLTALPRRRDLRRFLEEIAWGTSVWIAEEPYRLIHFVSLRSDDGELPPHE